MKRGVIDQRHRHFRLAEEIRDQLGRIVAAGIFEIEEDHVAVSSASAL